jgi:hypothetical protein
MLTCGCLVFFWSPTNQAVVACIPGDRKSEEEIIRLSDVVADVEVRKVVCIKRRWDPDERKDICTYRSTVELMTVKKGTVKTGQRLVVEWIGIPGCSWSMYDAYCPGEILATHLRWDARRKAYVTTWWNGKETLAQPEALVLPANPGDWIESEDSTFLALFVDRLWTYATSVAFCVLGGMLLGKVVARQYAQRMNPNGGSACGLTA